MFTAGWLIAGRAEPGYDPRSQYISSLAAADAHEPWIMVGAFVAFGIGVMALGHRLSGALLGRTGRAGAATVMACGVGIIVSGVARHDCSVGVTDCMERVAAGLVSTQHVVHDIASGAVFLLGALSQVLVALSARRMPGWQRVWPAALISGVLTLVLFVTMNLGAFDSWTGALERTLVVVAGICVCLLARHLTRMERVVLAWSDHDEQAAYEEYDEQRPMAA